MIYGGVTRGATSATLGNAEAKEQRFFKQASEER
jgi:hypothetical protein